MTCLDTSFLIALERRVPAAVGLMQEWRGSSAPIVPAVVWMEYLAGLRPSLWLEAQRIVSRSATLVPFGEAEAHRAALLQQACLASGRRRQWTDLQIAATAVEAGVPLVTLDTDFRHIPGLDVVVP